MTPKPYKPPVFTDPESLREWLAHGVRSEENPYAEDFSDFKIRDNGDGTATVLPATVGPEPLHPNDPKGAAGAAKTQLHLLPTVALVAGANVLHLGSKKYGAFNFREAKVNATTYVSAIMRHLSAWNDGEDLDPESGESHIAHIMANCCIILDAQAHGTLLDDRWKPNVIGGARRGDSQIDQTTSSASAPPPCSIPLLLRGGGA